MNNTELSQDIELFYVNSSARKSLETLRAYKSTFNLLIEYLNKNNSELNEKSINNWLIDLKENGDSNRTLNRHLYALKAYLKYSKKLELINNIETYVIDIQEQIAIPVIQLKKLLDYCISPFNTLLITILISTGAKICEIAQLKKSDIIEYENFLAIKLWISNKKNKTRFVPIKAEWAIDNIKNSIQELEKGKPLEFIFLGKGVDSLRYSVKEIARSAGMPFIHPHTFRHTYITELFKKGVNIYQIKNLTGLSSAVVRDCVPKETLQDAMNFTPEI